MADFRVDETALAERVASSAMKCKEWKASTDFGGSLSAVEYRRVGKAPLTEVALAISDPSGLTVVFVDSCEGYAVTQRKIAMNCIPGTCGIDVFDKRVKNRARLGKGWEALRSLHESNFSAMEKLASAAD